jgi:hypothetical protein
MNTETYDYVVVGAYSGKVFAAGVGHTLAAGYARSYGRVLPPLGPGGEWRSHPDTGQGVIIRRAAEGA